MSQRPKDSENAPRNAGASIDTGYGTENPAIDRAFEIAFKAHPPKARGGRRITVCAASELPPGTRRIVETGDGISIGVFNVEGRLYAVKNVCPHYGAPLCQGSLHATHRPAGVHVLEPVLEGRILRCPWHGWEFDIASGKGLFDHNSRVATYVVEVNPQGDVEIVL